jgi:hypothetical protein
MGSTFVGPNSPRIQEPTSQSYSFLSLESQKSPILCSSVLVKYTRAFHFMVNILLFGLVKNLFLLVGSDFRHPRLSSGLKGKNTDLNLWVHTYIKGALVPYISLFFSSSPPLQYNTIQHHYLIEHYLPSTSTSTLTRHFPLLLFTLRGANYILTPFPSTPVSSLFSP